MDYFLGCIAIFPFGFAPKGWFQCNGALLPINQYQALFSLIGTYYGGNGTSNFALPDLRGRTVLSSGQSPSSGNIYTNGQIGGVENVTLITQQIPAHTHLFNVNNTSGTGLEPGEILASPTGLNFYGAPGGATTSLNPNSILPYGGSGITAHSNLQPYLTLNFCIAYNGIYPSRN